jgi:TadE-like protein
MIRRVPRELGQAVIEFGIMGVAFLMLTVGLVDAGVAFFQYNELSALAGYGSRWGSVVGGTCALPEAVSSSDWCNRFGAASGANPFWTKETSPPTPPAPNGNTPIQGYGVSCPPYSQQPANVAPTDYYTMQSYVGTPTIVGAIAQKYDSNSSSANFVKGETTVGMDRSKVFVCIATSNNGGTSQPTPGLGDTISVTVGYNFVAASGLFGGFSTFPMSATSIYKVE